MTHAPYLQNPSLRPQINTLLPPVLGNLKALPRLPLRDPPRQFRIALVANERPALFVVAFSSGSITVHVGAVLDERSGVFQVPIDGLDGRCNTIFLRRNSQYLRSRARRINGK